MVQRSTSPSRPSRRHANWSALGTRVPSSSGSTRPSSTSRSSSSQSLLPLLPLLPNQRKALARLSPEFLSEKGLPKGLPNSYPRDPRVSRGRPRCPERMRERSGPSRPSRGMALYGLAWPSKGFDSIRQRRGREPNTSMALMAFMPLIHPPTHPPILPPTTHGPCIHPPTHPPISIHSSAPSP